MKKHFYIVMAFLAAIVVCGYLCLYLRWRHLWGLEKPRQFYHITHRQSDTLKVVMIGDSWAGMHHEHDVFLQAQLQKSSGFPAFFMSKGKGGEKSKGIYQLLYKDDDEGTRPLITLGPDYCVISAGINDAAANLGAEQFCHYYCQIICFLLANHIKPVVLEYPNVNMWTIYQHKPIIDLCSDFLKSTMTHSGMYEYSGYREALKLALIDNHLMNQVIYIQANEWNGNPYDINIEIFLEDRIHLNREGYELLDICIAQKIAEDYKSRKMPLFSISQ